MICVKIFSQSVKIHTLSYIFTVRELFFSPFIAQIPLSKEQIVSEQISCISVIHSEKLFKFLTRACAALWQKCMPFFAANKNILDY